MEIRKFQRYGYDCIIYTTLILDEDMLIVVERVSGWGGNIPRVKTYTENAQEKFEELVSELEELQNG